MNAKKGPSNATLEKSLGPVIPGERGTMAPTFSRSKLKNFAFLSSN